VILHKYIKEELIKLNHLDIGSIVLNKKGFVGRKISENSWEIKGLDPSTKKIFDFGLNYLIADLTRIVLDYTGDIIIIDKNGTRYSER